VTQFYENPYFFKMNQTDDKEEGPVSQPAKSEEHKKASALSVMARHLNVEPDQAAYNREYYLANREKIAARKREYHLANQKKIAVRKREYNHANRERIVAQNREYRSQNPERVKKWRSAHYVKFRDQIAIRDRERREKNREQLLAKDRQYHAKNREVRLAKMSEYAKKNREAIALRMREWVQKNRTMLREAAARRYYERLKTEPAYKMLRTLRARQWQALKGQLRFTRTMELLGCTAQQAREHLESKFLPGMNWGNHGIGQGKWHIDHIIPCAAFDLTKEEEQARCFHWSNLQPLWAPHNLSKGAKFDYES
jgi:hypothetical protein